MDFEAVADELFAAKREDFTALRDERAKQARPDRALADRIADLRKPTVAAWLVNQVSRNCPEEVDRLAELGESLRHAHQQLAGPELRTLSRQRHELIEMLSKRAHWLARKAGYAFSDATGRQVEDTFEAAVSDEQALDAVRGARLSAALTPGSPEQWLTAAVMPAKAPARPKRAPAQKAPPPAPGKQAPAKKPAERPSRPSREKERVAAAREKAAREQERRKAARDKARQEAEAAAKARDEAEQALSEAEQRAEEVAATVADLRARLDEATEAERDLRTEVAAARKALKTAERAAAAAQKRAGELD
jgi:chromosome segregation ATPase